MHPSIHRPRILRTAILWYLIDILIAAGINNRRWRTAATAATALIRIGLIIQRSGENEERAAAQASHQTITELDQIWTDRNAPPTHG